MGQMITSIDYFSLYCLKWNASQGEYIVVITDGTVSEFEAVSRLYHSCRCGRSHSRPRGGWSERGISVGTAVAVISLHFSQEAASQALN